MKKLAILIVITFFVISATTLFACPTKAIKISAGEDKNCLIYIHNGFSESSLEKVKLDLENCGIKFKSIKVSDTEDGRRLVTLNFNKNNKLLVYVKRIATRSMMSEKFEYSLDNQGETEINGGCY